MTHLIRTALMICVASIPCLAQTELPCLAKGTVSYSSTASPPTSPLTLNIGAVPALEVSLVPNLNDERGASVLKAIFRRHDAHRSPLKIVADSEWFGTNEVSFDAALYANINPDNPDEDTVQLPDLGLSVQLDVEASEAKTMPFEFLNLKVEVCARRIDPTSKP